MKSRLSVVGLFVCPFAAAAQSTIRVSVDSTGVQANGGNDRSRMSADGRYVVFESAASNLAPGDTNGQPDVYVHDRLTGTTERVSVSSGGGQGNNESTEASISADGRYVLFASKTTNLVVGDTNGASDMFVRDRQAATTVRVSVDSGGIQANGDTGEGSLSGDGRFAAFDSGASNLVAGDTNNILDVFVHDLQTGLTTRSSVDSSGGQANGGSLWPALSGDGRYVVFYSAASNLVPNDINGRADIFVRDTWQGTTSLVSVDSNGTQANDDSAGFPAISTDGRCVAFFSLASNLVTGDTNGIYDVFVRDPLTGTTARVSVDSAGAQSNGPSFEPSISGDGRFIAFQSTASNLVVADTNNFDDIFVHDRLIGMTVRASVDSSGTQANFHCWPIPGISASGRFVTFSTPASNLVAGDTNADTDIFVHELDFTAPHTYCTGGTTTSGCVASISATSNPTIGYTTPCLITVAHVEGDKIGIVFYGLAPLAQSWCTAGGSFQCVKAPTFRVARQNSGGTPGSCGGSLQFDWNAYQLSAASPLGSPWMVGDHAYVQGWFRDPPNCKGTSLSDGVELTYQP